jgi:rRNA maturation endonuclease Nob1
MNLNDLIITKVKNITLYKTQCPNCGWKNSLSVMAHYCPKCGKDLLCMKFTTLPEVEKLPDSIECLGGIDLAKF